MPALRTLKLLYAAVSLSWMLYWDSKLLSIPAAQRNPNPMALVFCLLLFAAIPTLGYVLLFLVFPRALRSLRRS